MNGLICRMGLAFMEFISSMGGFHQIQTRADVKYSILFCTAYKIVGRDGIMLDYSICYKVLYDFIHELRPEVP